MTDSGMNWREGIRRARALADDPAVDEGLRAALHEKLAELDRIVAWFRAVAAPDDLPSFTCPVCHMTSYHPADVEHGYCGDCHSFTAEPFWSDPPDEVVVHDIDVGVPAVTPGLYRGVLRDKDGAVLVRCTTRFLSAGDTVHLPTMTTTEN